MKKPILSIIVPGIRPQNWPRLYNSCDLPKQDFEMIFVGPWDNQEITNEPNVKFFKDFGNPSRCQNIGLCLAEGEWIHWTADDAYFLDNEPTSNLDEAINSPNILCSQYSEGDSTDHKNMEQDIYYKMWVTSPYYSQFHNVNNEWFNLNAGFVKRKLLEEFGGWDSQFESATWAHMDLAIRLQRAGYKVDLYRKPLIHCDHLMKETGDHGPIHHACIDHDIPLYNRIYLNPENKNREKIDINNWKNVDKIWKRRFNP